jgi:hypothetical protein
MRWHLYRLNVFGFVVFGFVVFGIRYLISASFVVEEMWRRPGIMFSCCVGKGCDSA